MFGDSAVGFLPSESNFPPTNRENAGLQSYNDRVLRTIKKPRITEDKKRSEATVQAIYF